MPLGPVYGRVGFFPTKFEPNDLPMYVSWQRNRTKESEYRAFNGDAHIDVANTMTGKGLASDTLWIKGISSDVF